MLSFGMRSQISFAPGKEFLVRLPFELPISSSIVGAVTLKSHELEPAGAATGRTHPRPGRPTAASTGGSCCAPVAM